MSQKDHIRILAGVGAEVFFAGLPLVVVIMFSVFHPNSKSSVYSPEWSFGAAILFGQALVKFVSGPARRGNASLGPVKMAMAMLLVIGLVPSLIVLTFTLESLEHGVITPTPMPVPLSWPLMISQLALFFISAVSYLVFGTLGELWDRA